MSYTWDGDVIAQETIVPGKRVVTGDERRAIDTDVRQWISITGNAVRRADLDEFVGCYLGLPVGTLETQLTGASAPGEVRPTGEETPTGSRHERAPSWTEATPEGRWRAFDYEELARRDKCSLDLFWLKDKSLEDSDDLPEPDVLAQEIMDDLATALEQFGTIHQRLAT